MNDSMDEERLNWWVLCMPNGIPYIDEFHEVQLHRTKAEAAAAAKWFDPPRPKPVRIEFTRIKFTFPQGEE